MSDSQWIAVNERHPRTSDPHDEPPVMAAYDGHVFAAKYRNGCFYTMDGAPAILSHWMPLPAPPTPPDAFERWWQLNSIWLDAEGNLKSQESIVTKRTAKFIWDCAVDSVRLRPDNGCGSSNT